MRKPDFEAIHYALNRATVSSDKTERMDFLTLANALTWICRASEDTVDKNMLDVMADVIDKLAPQQRLEDAERNLSIVDKLSGIDRFYTTVREVQQDIASSESLSTERVAKIHQGKIADTTLAEFVQKVRHGDHPPLMQITVARNAIVKIRRQLIRPTGKGQEMRAKVCDGFGAIGKTTIAEENFSEVETLMQKESIAANAAAIIIARTTGQEINKVKTDHQRYQSQATKNLDSAVKAANNEIIISDNDGNLIRVLKPVTRKDLLTALNKTDSDETT